MLKYLVLFGLILPTILFAVEPAQVLQKSGDRFRGAEFWSFDFQMLSFLPGQGDTVKFKGELKLGKGDRFRVNIPGQEFVSDGINLWQYSKTQKQVMIKSVMEMKGGLHPSEALFRYLKCKPLTMHDSVYEGVPVHVMKLDPQGQVKQFTGMTVWLKHSDQTPMRLETIDKGGGMMVYKISNLRRNPPLKDADFRFVTPPGVEEMDMR